MDIYTLLKDDHDKQRGLSAALMETSGDSADRRRLFRELMKEVEAHAAAEEQTFYAELIAHEEGQEKARHSITEHSEAAEIIEALSEMDMSSGGWLNKFKTLKEALEHHVDEEEEEVFPLAQGLIDKARARKLGQAFEEAKKSQLAA